MSVSAIVPARNEQDTIVAAVESLAAQAEITEIFVVNDQSTDGTAAQLTRLSARFPQLRVSQTGELPSGWVGKNYAVSLGAALATGEWLLFTDADGVHLPGSTARAMADAAAFGAGLVSYSPEQEMRTWWERSLIPFVYTRLAAKFSYNAVNDPDSPAAAANGQYLLIRREDYARIGGHAAVASEVLEDVALARLAKERGIRLHFSSGSGSPGSGSSRSTSSENRASGKAVSSDAIMRVRMYRTFKAMWQGWAKNLYPLIAGTSNVRVVNVRAGAKSRAVGRELRSVVPWIPLLMLLLTPVHLILGVLGVVLLAGRHAEYAATLRRNRFPASLALYYMPGVALYAAVLLASERRYARGIVEWKGRKYPVVDDR